MKLSFSYSMSISDSSFTSTMFSFLFRIDLDFFSADFAGDFCTSHRFDRNLASNGWNSSINMLKWHCMRCLNHL